MPALIVISVALLMDQESVDAWPRSMVDGSAAKLLIVGRAAGGGGAGGGFTTGGGGGGGGGTFFLQDDANSTSANTSKSAAILDTYSLLSFILSSLLFCYNAHVNRAHAHDLLTCFSPNRLFVVSLSCELLHCCPIGQHGVKLNSSPALGGEYQMYSIRRPAWVFVSSLPVSKLHDHAGRHVHGKDVEVAGFKSTSPRKSNMLAIGAPGGIHSVAFPRGQAGNIRSIYIHSIY